MYNNNYNNKQLAVLNGWGTSYRKDSCSSVSNPLVMTRNSFGIWMHSRLASPKHARPRTLKREDIWQAFCLSVWSNFLFVFLFAKKKEKKLFSLFLERENSGGGGAKQTRSINRLKIRYLGDVFSSRSRYTAWNACTSSRGDRSPRCRRRYRYCADL